MGRLDSTAGSITTRRSARLYCLLSLLARGPKPRDFLLRKLRTAPRGFYRDLQKLRQFQVKFALHEHRYRLAEPFQQAISRLPFPDPRLNWQEALQLSAGSSPACRKLRTLIRRLTAETKS